MDKPESVNLVSPPTATKKQLIKIMILTIILNTLYSCRYLQT